MLLHTANPIIPEYLQNVNDFAIQVFDFSIPLAIPPEFHYNTTAVSFQNSNNVNYGGFKS